METKVRQGFHTLTTNLDLIEASRGEKVRGHRCASCKSENTTLMTRFSLTLKDNGKLPASGDFLSYDKLCIDGKVSLFHFDIYCRDCKKIDSPAISEELLRLILMLA
jgi:hypothetical protein